MNVNEKKQMGEHGWPKIVLDLQNPLPDHILKQVIEELQRPAKVIAVLGESGILKESVVANAAIQVPFLREVRYHYAPDENVFSGEGPAFYLSGFDRIHEFDIRARTRSRLRRLINSGGICIIDIRHFEGLATCHQENFAGEYEPVMRYIKIPLLTNMVRTERGGRPCQYETVDVEILHAGKIGLAHRRRTRHRLRLIRL